MGIEAIDVSKRFGDFQAVAKLSLSVETGSLVALLGPSGSGKSTLLRLIAGLEMPDTGRIFLTGEDATYRNVRERNIGFVFQHYALFKHMTVRQNIAFGLEIRKASKKFIQERVDELLALVQLQGLGNRYPSQLSGGQRQRVALARALAVQPKVLLLDEPFGALDAQVRKELRQWLRRLHDDMHVTTVFVTHDQEEAMEVADRIVVMNRGCLEQVGTPAEIYDRPASEFVMQFIGPVNILRGDHGLACTVGERVFVRPHDVTIETTPDLGSVSAHVRRIINLGWEVQIELNLRDGQALVAHLPRDTFEGLRLRVGQEVFVSSKEARSFTPDYAI
ncbi:MAG: TOBE-like domain-containing protein [Pseudanabaenaceae cyanobacterium]